MQEDKFTAAFSNDPIVCRSLRSSAFIPLLEETDEISMSASMSAWDQKRKSTRLALNGGAGQLLRKASAVPDASGKPDDFINLGGVTSWIKSLSASVSNGLRSILKFGAAAFAASL